MKILLHILIILFYFNVNTVAQVSQRNYNLDFKQIKNNFPLGWRVDKSVGYDIEIDSNQLYLGKPSLKIKSSDKINSGAGVIAFDIPDNLKGENLIFSAQIKTDGVSRDGQVGIYGDVKPKIDFQNLEALNINGTHDWNGQSITLKLSPDETDKITIGLYLFGEGTVWFSNLNLFVDNENYKNASIYQLTADSIYRFKSNISPFELNTHNQNLLKDIAQIWGVIKYFHPSVAQGKWNMDAELFKFIPKILASKSKEEQELLFIKWIDGFGKLPVRLKREQDERLRSGLKLKMDLAWIDELGYSNNLKKLLFQLTALDHLDNHKYLGYFDGPDHPEIKELSYRKAQVDDVGFRLLGLFRYWNAIQYFSPYRYLTARPWTKVLDAFIPTFYKANTREAIDSAYLKLFSQINDSHAFASLSDPYNATVYGDKGLGFRVKIIDEKVVVSALGTDSLGRENGLLVGDVITEVNDVSIVERIQSRRPFIAASNEKVALRDIAGILFRTKDKELKIKFLRDGLENSITISTAQVSSIQSVLDADNKPFKLIRGQIGYIQGGKFKEADLSSFLNLIEGKKGIIIDLRQYPIDYLHNIFSNYLFPQKRAFAKLTSSRGLKPGEFAVKHVSTIGKDNPYYYKGKIVVLIDENSQSASEFQCMAFRTIPEVTVVGRNSAGADGNISWIPLPFGLKTAFSGCGVYYPNMDETQGIGLIPDIYVAETVEDVKTRKDKILEKAIQLFY